MNWLAWRMLTGDTTKYLGIVFGVALGSLLIAQQMSIFVGLMRRTSSQILDVTDANIWVMDRWTQNIDEIRPMPDNRLYQVRGVKGVDWAVRLYKGQVRVRLRNGNFKQAILLGVDDTSLAGAPRIIHLGQLSDLRRPDGIFVDKIGYEMLFPGQPLELGRTVEMNDRRAVIVGICKAEAPFQSFPVIFTRYSQATQFVPRERNLLSFILARSRPDTDVHEVCRRIREQTDLQAMTWTEFFFFNINYFMENTGIPVNFGITILLGFIVGAAIAGQTFYLFTIENLKQFGSLKAMGVTNFRLIGMILLQATVVGLMGLSIGLGLAAGFFEGMQRSGQPDLRDMGVPWYVALITTAAVGCIVFLASLLSLRKVLVLEPAMVFK